MKQAVVTQYLEPVAEHGLAVDHDVLKHSCDHLLNIYRTVQGAHGHAVELERAEYTGKETEELSRVLV